VAGQQVSDLEPLDGVAMAVYVHIESPAMVTLHDMSGGLDPPVVLEPGPFRVEVALCRLLDLPIRVELATMQVREDDVRPLAGPLAEGPGDPKGEVRRVQVRAGHAFGPIGDLRRPE